MYPFYYAVVILVSIVALISTIVIARDMTKKEKEHNAEEDLESLKADGKNSSIPLLTTIYAITFAITIILVWIFIF
ncbi:hypothetical protein [Halobacillus yeomjeoni]|uniref:Uncharacterized protein n=1 Tax=Halobacillus yeomjeoni TaxID=311194 RepID=A0A931HXE6_9BACI|nr:hypothetical protein [Halobacillus yeomjeoni]MBH0231258.1 hypothetical protein [Halobacillus yeomjeoni]